MRRLFKGFAMTVLITMLIGAIVTAPTVYKGYKLYKAAIKETTIAEKVAEIKRSVNYVDLDDISDYFKDEIIKSEDKRFRFHFGIDPLAIVRAIKNDLLAGSFVEGGSTITQQLAKNQYFTQEQTVERKIAEVFMALTMEQHFSKRTILELYVNSIYFGDGYEGIGSASWGYFGKAPSALDADECTLLAGIPNAPSVYALSQNPGLARERQQEVLRKLVSYDYLGQDAAQHILGNLRALAA